MKECNLCKKQRKLLESHIIPKFVFRWMKKTGTQFFRKGTSPNVRNQDGFKDYLFCAECEKILSEGEKWFSENIFTPYLATNNCIFVYNELLGKFIVSILWRIVLDPEIKDSHQESNILKKINEAFEEWRDFLLSGKEIINYPEIHLFLIPDEWGTVQPNQYVTRYFARDIDGHIIDLDGECWVYAKFARFMLFGRISGYQKTFRNTRINFTLGNTMPGQYIDSLELSSYLIHRAESIYTHFKKHISPNQLQIIEDFMLKNFDKIENSDLGKRLQQDYSAKIDPSVFSLSFNYLCDCCCLEISAPAGFLLRTFEIISSALYFSEYFHSLGLTKSKEDLDARIELFKNIAGQDSPWVICEICSEKFEFDKLQAKKFMEEWIKQKGDFCPPKSGNFREHLTKEQLHSIIHTIVTV